MMATKRKPYIREMKSTWWKKSAFYRFYMLREGTAVPAVWISVVLLYGLGALNRGPESFAAFVEFLANPIVLLVNLVALLAAVLHTKTWFVLAPKAVRIPEKRERGLILGLWLATVVVTALLLALAL